MLMGISLLSLLVLSSAFVHSANASSTLVKTVTLVGGGGMVYDSGRNEIFIGGDGVLFSDSTYNETPSGSNNSLTIEAYDSVMGELWGSVENTQTYVFNITVVSDTTFKTIGNIPLPYSFVPVYPSTMVYDSGKGEVFVMLDNGTMLVVSDETDEVVAQIQGAGGATLAYDSGAGEIWVDGSTAGLTAVSDSTNKIVANVTVPGLSSLPGPIVYDSAKGEIWLTDNYNGEIEVISDTANQIVAKVSCPTPSCAPSLGSAISTATWPILYDSGNGEVYAAYNPASGPNSDLTVISDSTNTIIQSITLPKANGTHGVYDMIYDPGNGDIIAETSGSTASPTSVPPSTFFVVSDGTTATASSGQATTSTSSQISSTSSSPTSTKTALSVDFVGVVAISMAVISLAFFVGPNRYRNRPYRS